jgi:hypothetical protein
LRIRLTLTDVMAKSGHSALPRRLPSTYRRSIAKPDETEVDMTTKKRMAGPIGTAVRVLLGLGLLYLAGGASIASWAIEPQDAVIGLIALPALAVGLGLAARRYAHGPIHFTGPLGIAINLAVIVALVGNDFTGGGATIFYGVTLLVAAWLGQAGCEATLISNVVHGRDDQIGCPTLTPIDAAKAHLRRRVAATEARQSG